MIAPARPAILLVGDTLNLGGTEGQFVEIACRLDRSRWDVHVSCLSASGPLSARLEAAGVRAWSCGRGSFKSLRFVGAVRGLARDLRAKKIRLVHTFDFYSNVLGVLAARLAGVPVVIASQRDLGNLRPHLQGRVHRMALRLAHRVVVNAQAVAERVVLDRAAAPDRIVLVPNGVDIVRFAPAPRSQRCGREIVVGTLANLRPEKGLETFVRAMALVRERWPEARFVIWGEGPLRADLERLIRSLRLSDAVELRGSTAQPETALRELDILVLPSLSEACSNVLLEAMATGLPVVATRVGGNAAVVEDEETGLLVPPGDPLTLAKAIIRLLEQPTLASQLAVAGRAHVRAAFSMERMLSRVETLYENALTKRVVVAGYYPPPFAGEPIHVRQLAALLCSKGMDVEIVNLNRHAAPSKEYRNARGRLALLAILFRCLDRRTVFHLHTNGHSWKSWALILRAGVAAWLRGSPSILTIHSGLFPGYVRRFGPSRIGVARWVLAPFRRIVCVNQDIAAAVRRLGVHEDSVRVIPAFLGVPEERPLFESDRRAIDRFRPFLVAVGGGDKDPELGLPIVVRALKEVAQAFPHVGAAFIGWHVGPKVTRLIREVGLEPHAICLGQVSHERCLALLRASDIVVRSTFEDGDAITVREALALGVPVVASDTPFRPEGTILFRKGDRADLVEKLVAVLKHEVHVAPYPIDTGASTEDALLQVYGEVVGAEPGTLEFRWRGV